MSRLYFHSPSGKAELHGAEFHWLRRLADRPAEGAWDLDGSSRLERAQEILALVPADGGPDYLRDALATSLQADRTGGNVFDAINRLVQALRLAMRVDGLTFEVAGIRLRSANVDANTALVAGSDPMRLAVKLGHWGEQHAWVEGADRAWAADIIDEGLRTGLYRRGLWFADTPGGPKDRWSDLGWDDVTTFLRARDDEPVVSSYSVGESFPNREIAGWVPPDLGVDWVPEWASGDGLDEWRAMSDEARDDYRREYAAELWYEVPEAERWDLGMAGLRRDRPWARLAPDTLAEVTFHLPVTVYDLLAADRDERVRAAANLVDA